MKNNFSTKILVFAKKIKAINLLGGKCLKCGNDNIFSLCFHHINPKEKEIKITDLFHRNWNRIEYEVKKCELMCQNCHQELHDDLKNETRRNNKFLYLEYIGQKECDKCGYDKCESNLTFHHLKDKKFQISKKNGNFNSLEDIKKIIKEELDKCEILCRNCHQIQHSNVKFFNDNIDLINEKVKNFKMKQSKLNRNLIKKLYFEDKMKQINIAKYLNASKGTICDIIKKMKIEQKILL